MPDGSGYAPPPEKPSLLSQVPVYADPPPIHPAKMWEATYSHCESRVNSLITWRYSWWQHWGALAEYFSPRRYNWLPVANRMSRGRAINDQIVDSTGLQALRTCAGGMWSGLTNPNTPWFKLGIALDWIALDAPEKAWLEDTTKKIQTILGQGNFYDIMAQVFADDTLFGTSPVIVYEDAEDVVRFYLPVTGEYALAVNDTLRHDTMAREFTFTTAQIVQRWGLDACPPAVQRAWSNQRSSLDQEWVVRALIEPNFEIADRKSGKSTGTMVPTSFPYREIYWVKGQKAQQPLEAKGFNSFPVGVFTWYTSSNDAYGRSPCMEALGDVKQVQLETQRKAEFIEKGVRPPMIASVQMKNEPASILPGHITYVTTDAGGINFKPAFEPNAAWLTALTADIEAVNERIERCLFVDLFMAITNMQGVQPRSELELNQRNMERLQSLGPVITSTEGTLAQIIQRVLDVAMRRRILAPLPPSLQGVPLKLSFISMLRMAQRAAETLTIKDTLATAGSLQEAAQAARLPAPIRVLNLDKAMREYADVAGFPISCVYTEDEVAANDKAHAQAQQQAQAPNNLMAGVQAAQGLSQTKIGQGSALDAILGTGAPPTG